MKIRNSLLVALLISLIGLIPLIFEKSSYSWTTIFSMFFVWFFMTFFITIAKDKLFHPLIKGMILSLVVFSPQFINASIIDDWAKVMVLIFIVLGVGVLFGIWIKVMENHDKTKNSPSNESNDEQQTIN